MSRTSKTMLNNSGESGHPGLVPDLRGNAFVISPLRIIFAVALSYMAAQYQKNKQPDQTMGRKPK